MRFVVVDERMVYLSNDPVITTRLTADFERLPITFEFGVQSLNPTKNQKNKQMFINSSAIRVP